MFSNLRVEDLVHALVHDGLCVVAQELQNVFHLRLVRKAAEADAVFAGPRGDHVLREHRGGGGGGGRGLNMGENKNIFVGKRIKKLKIPGEG